MKLIVGLGNPGLEYKKTRHNVGYSLLDFIVENINLSFNKTKFGGTYIETVYNGEKIIILKPETFINLSGEVIKKYIGYYKIDKNNILVIHDDLDMMLGKIKIVFDSSSGGHNGIKNIEEQLGTQEYPRLKIGISNNKEINTRDYVLGKFNEEEEKIINSTYEKLKNIIYDFNDLSIEHLKAKYNNK